MEGFRYIVGLVNTVLWDYILIFALIGIGVFMTVRLKFPQFTRLFPALKKMVAGVIKKEKVEEGKMSPFQALSTAFGAPVLGITIVLAIVVALILMGGMGRIASFAESNVKYLFSSKSLVINGFKAIAITSLVVGTLVDATFVWELADMSMGFMAIPSIIALFLLSKDVKNILDDYDSKVALGNVHWEYEYEYENAEEKKNKKSRLGQGITTTVIK